MTLTVEMIVPKENIQKNRLNLIYFIGQIDGFD